MATSLLDANRRLAQENQHLKDENVVLQGKIADQQGRDLRIEATQRDLDRVNGWLATAENRVYVMLTFQGVVLAVTSFLGGALISFFGNEFLKPLQHLGPAINNTINRNLVAMVLSVCVAVPCLLISLILIVASLLDRTFSRNGKLFYLAVAKQEPSCFASNRKSQSIEDIEDALNRQLHAQALIVRQKLAFLLGAGLLVAVQLIAVAVFLYATLNIGIEIYRATHASSPHATAFTRPHAQVIAARIVVRE